MLWAPGLPLANELTCDRDGIDLDWEYPFNDGAEYMETGEKQADKTHEPAAYVELMRLLQDKAKKKGLTEFVLSAAVPAVGTGEKAWTEETIPQMDACLDHWNLMTYDYMNRRSGRTTHHSGGKVVKDTIDMYHGKGLPTEKMYVGQHPASESDSDRVV